MLKLVSLVLAFGIVISHACSAGSMVFDDLYCFSRVGDPQISPDGKKTLFDLTTTNLDSNSSITHIWEMNREGTSLRQLTNGPTGEWHPRWSPDGRYIAFESDRDGNSQIWILPADGGEARKVTSLSTGASGFEWSPQGDKFIFVSRVYPDCPNDSCNKARQEREDKNPIKALEYDHLLFRHYNSWDDGELNQLFISDADGKKVRQLTCGPYNAPTATLGGYIDYALSNDGKEVCFVMNTDSIPTLSTNNDLFVMALADMAPVRITQNRGQDHSPVYSPDGKYISYLSQARAGYESDQNDIILYDRKMRKHLNMTSEFDRSVDYFRWDPRGKYIYFMAIDRGFNKVWRLSVDNRKMEAILSDAVYGDLAVSPDGSFLIVSRSLSNQPYELYSYDINSKGLKRLTSYSEDLVNRVKMRQAEEFWFAGSFGDSIHGFLTLPPDFDSEKKYPMVLLIHGGPQWCWLGNFNYYGWNTQLMAAQGYVVAQIDPHGSAGYGIKFQEYVSGNWGRGDYEDLMKGVDYLISKYLFIDSTRMAALGRSYGGFMAFWICGQTDRFRCLIGVDGIFDQISGYYASDELWFPEWEFKGSPLTNREEYIRSSPSTYAANFRTPTMVIHSQKDYRVDVSQAFQMFTALQLMGVPSQLLYFPDESHSIQKLGNLRYVYEKQFEWLAKWFK